MLRKLHGNLNHAVRQDELERLFARHAAVRFAEVTNQLGPADITDTGRRRDGIRSAWRGADAAGLTSAAGTRPALDSRSRNWRSTWAS